MMPGVFDAPAHGASLGNQASLPQFARALQEVASTVGPVHGLVGHSLGGAAVSLALHRGLSARRVVLLAPPADVFVFTHAFAEHLRIPPQARIKWPFPCCWSTTGRTRRTIEFLNRS